MAAIRITKWSGLVPRVDPKNLGSESGTTQFNTQVAVDCDLTSGPLVPIKVPLPVYTLPDVNQKTIYKYKGDWLSWPTDVDVAHGPIANDQYDRIYFTGDGVPKVRGWDADSSGVPKSTRVIMPLGVPRPVNAPKVAVQSKSKTSWTRKWYYFYEGPDGTQYDNGVLNEGTTIVQTTPAVLYTVPSIPAAVTAPPGSKFIVYCDGFAGTGSALGRVYPNISMEVGNSDLDVSGAKVSEVQINGATSATITFSYDTSTASQYTKNRAYVYTFVSKWAEESAPSDPSADIAVMPTQDCVVSGMDTSVVDRTNIVKKRIYRTVTGNNQTNYQLVDEIDLTTASYTDSLMDEETNDVLITQDFDPPPSDLKGLISIPGGFLAGFSGNAVYFCQINYPHAWPSGYQYVFKHDIVGLGVVGNTLVITTTGPLETLTGVDPASMTQAALADPQSCKSKRGIVSMSGQVIWPSPDGLMSSNGGSPYKVTDGFYTREQWNALDPGSMIINVYDNNIFIVSSVQTTLIAFDPTGLTITTTSQSAKGLYSDPETDTLYLIQGNQIVQWRAGAKNLTAQARSREIPFMVPWAPVVARVIADAYPVSLTFFANNAPVLTLDMDDDVARKLPVLRKEKYWSFEVISDSKVNELLIAESMAQP